MKKRIILIITFYSIIHLAFSQSNTKLGQYAGSYGSSNTNIGYSAGRANNGIYNAFLGYDAGRNNANGATNSFFGARSGHNSTGGSGNALFGYNSGYGNINGGSNTYLGAYSGNNSTGSRNIFIGYQAGYYELGSDKLYIDNTNTASPLIYGDFSTDIVAINGKLGIGTSSPQKLLHIDTKKTRDGLSIYSEGNGMQFSDIEFRVKNQEGFDTGLAKDWIISHRKDGYFSDSPSTGSTLEFYSTRPGGGYFAPLVFKANGDVLLASPKQAVSGNVGVGLVNPTEKMEIDGNVFINKDNSGIIIDGNGKKRVGLMKYTGHEAGIWRANTQDFEIGRVTSLTDITEGPGNSPVVDMYFSPSGNIGIGTTTPSSRLAVDGKITAREVEVTVDGWADFVFEEDYYLPDLVDVEAHIKEKKHLPGIPSAAEVGENGINLGVMDALLLQKIEELTLYMIEQEKQLKELKEEIKSLQTSTNK